MDRKRVLLRALPMVLTSFLAVAACSRGLTTEVVGVGPLGALRDGVELDVHVVRDGLQIHSKTLYVREGDNQAPIHNVRDLAGWVSEIDTIEEAQEYSSFLRRYGDIEGVFDGWELKVHEVGRYGFCGAEDLVRWGVATPRVEAGAFVLEYPAFVGSTLSDVAVELVQERIWSDGRYEFDVVGRLEVGEDAMLYCPQRKD